MLVTLWSSISVPKRNYIAICLTSYRISAGLHLLLNNNCTLHFVKKIVSDFRQFNKTFATCIKLFFGNFGDRQAEPCSPLFLNSRLLSSIKFSSNLPRVSQTGAPQ